MKNSRLSHSDSEACPPICSRESARADASNESVTLCSTSPAWSNALSADTHNGWPRGILLSGPTLFVPVNAEFLSCPLLAASILRPASVRNQVKHRNRQLVPDQDSTPHPTDAGCSKVAELLLFHIACSTVTHAVAAARWMAVGLKQSRAGVAASSHMLRHGAGEPLREAGADGGFKFQHVACRSPHSGNTTTCHCHYPITTHRHCYLLRVKAQCNSSIALTISNHTFVYSIHPIVRHDHLRLLSSICRRHGRSAQG